MCSKCVCVCVCGVCKVFVCVCAFVCLCVVCRALSRRCVEDLVDLGLHGDLDGVKLHSLPELSLE